MNPIKITSNQTVSVSGTSAAVATAFGAGTSILRLVSTTACFIKFGAAPTATASDMLLPANVVEYFGTTPGVKVAALQQSSAGTLYVTEMTE